jgi:cyclic pyranopterin phosphate synthase
VNEIKSDQQLNADEVQLSHIDARGRAQMVNVGEKLVTFRTATAEGVVWTTAETIRLIEQNAIAKGNVLAVARVAGIMAAKHTADLIPLCHTLPLTGVDVDITLNPGGTIRIVATAQAEGKTGVEMEALTAVAIAALTIYDMCKAVDRSMVIGEIYLVHKSGGRSGEWQHPRRLPGGLPQER